MVDAIASMSASTNKKYILQIFKQQIPTEKLIFRFSAVAEL